MAEILGVQIIGILFGIFMMYYTFLHYKRNEFKKIECGFWISLWIIFILVTVVPEILDPVVKSLNFARTFDLLIIVGFIFLTGNSFYMYTTAKKNQVKLEKVVREVAIKRAEKKE